MLEVIYTMLGNIPKAAITAISVGLLRNIAGWLENSYKDGKIDSHEKKQLIGTMIKYFSSVMILMLGMPLEQAVAGSFLLDTGTSAIKKIGKDSSSKIIK